jgi:secreted trypsin-like serine protease
LFQPDILCASYESAEKGFCQGHSGEPLMVFNTTLNQFFQVGIVSGGVSSSCGDKDIPGYFSRLDFPEVADFIRSVEPSKYQGNKFFEIPTFLD